MLTKETKYLLFKKIQELILKASTDVELQSIIAMQLQRDKSNNGSGSGGMKSMEELIGLINIVIDIKGIIASFEHCVIIMEYWKDEVKDCKIYQDFLKKILLDLQNTNNSNSSNNTTG